MTFLRKKITGDSVALIAGALLTLAFAPLEIYPLAVLCPALLFFTWLKISPKQAFWRGWLFGVGLYGAGVYWIFISVHTFGNSPAWLAALITAALVAFLALFPGLNGYFLNRYFPKLNFARIFLAFPVIWVFLEWVLTYIFTGFPWLLIGTTQVNSWLSGYAAIVSVYGVSLAVILSSSLIIFAILEYRNKRFSSFYLSLGLLAVLWIVGGCLNFISWTKPFGKPIKVSLVQGNIPQSVKWSPDQVMPTFDIYAKLSQAHWDSKLIIWPESAIPLPLQNAESFLEPLADEALKHHSTLILGIPAKANTPGDYYNAVFALGEGKGFYTKHRLVPFGEYVPFRDIFGRLLQFMDIPMSDFIPGRERSQPLIVDGMKIDVFICYEIAFPEQVLSYDGNSNLLITVSNDAWFGESIAQAQHLALAQMRALELRRPVLFVSNNGLTAIVDANGNLQNVAPPYRQFVLTDTVQPTQGKTPWQQYGSNPILLLLLYLLYKAIRLRKL